MSKKHKYTKEDIDAMRDNLAESEWEGLKDRDLRLILREGCVGWNNMSDADIIALYEPIYYPEGKSDWSASNTHTDAGVKIDSFEDVYGESDNYNLGEQVEQIICDKNMKDQQGEITAKFNDIK